MVDDGGVGSAGVGGGGRAALAAAGNGFVRRETCDGFRNAVEKTASGGGRGRGRRGEVEDLFVLAPLAVGRRLPQHGLSVTAAFAHDARDSLRSTAERLHCVHGRRVHTVVAGKQLAWAQDGPQSPRVHD